MKISIRKIFLTTVLSSIILANIYCAAAVVAAAFIPLIGAATWANTANNSNTFFFFSIKDNSNTSTFSGNENLIGGGQAPFTGSFTDHDITFVYDASSSKKGTYTGKVNDQSNSMTLTGSNSLPPLTLIKK